MSSMSYRRAYFPRCRREESKPESLQRAESLDGTDGDQCSTNRRGARPLRIFVFETINTPGAPFFRAASVGLTLWTLFGPPVASETLKPELIKLMVQDRPKRSGRTGGRENGSARHTGRGAVEKLKQMDGRDGGERCVGGR